MARPLALIGLSSLLSGLGSCTKAEPAAEAEPAAVAAPNTPDTPRAREASLDFLEVLDASQTTMLHIGDPYRHARRVLEGESLGRLYDSPAFAPVAAVGAPLDEMIGKLETARDIIPESVVFAADPALPDALLEVSRLTMLTSLCQSANEIGASKEFTARRVQLAEELESLRVPHVTVWAQFSTEDAAKKAFSLGLQASIAAPESLEITRAENEIAVSLLHDAPTAGAFVVPTLMQLGVLAEVEDPLAARIVDAVVALDLGLTLTRRGDALMLEFGPAPESRRPLEVADLGPHFDPKDADQVVWARWDVSSTKVLAGGTVEMLEASKKTKAGRHFIANDPIGLVGDVYDMQRTFAALAPTGTMKVSGGANVIVETWESGLPQSAALSQTELAALVPPDSPLYLLTSTYGVGDAVADALSEAEGRLATKNLGAAISSNGELERLTDAISTTYYEEFRELRKKVLREGPEQFEPGFGIVVGPAELFGRAKVQGLDALAGADQLPVPAVAMIGKAKSGADAKAWLESVVREVAASAVAASGHPRPSALTVAKDTDLGLGVPTRTFTLDWVGAAVPQFSVNVSDGAALHIFEHGGLLVVSTSAALSKAIIDPGRARLGVDVPEAVTFGRGDGGRLGSVVADLGSVIGGPGPSSAGAMLAAVFEAAGGMSWTARQDGGIRYSRFNVDFGTPP